MTPSRRAVARAERKTGLDHGVGHPTAASGLRHGTSALETQHVRGLRCAAV